MYNKKKFTNINKKEIFEIANNCYSNVSQYDKDNVNKNNQLKEMFEIANSLYKKIVLKQL